MSIQPDDYNKVLSFWFEELTPKQWFFDTNLDAVIKERFESFYHAIVAGETASSWRTHPEGALAEVLVLDQFARNMFRDTFQSFVYDPLALSCAQNIIAQGWDQEMDTDHRMFVYMPFMHSESLVIQDQSVELFESLGSEDTLKYAHMHRDVITRFGRFPGINKAMGRTDTPEEEEYNKSGSPF